MNIYSCTQDRSVLGSHGLLALSDWTVPTTSPWTRPSWNLPSVPGGPARFLGADVSGYDWKTMPVPAPLLGTPAGSPAGNPATNANVFDTAEWLNGERPGTRYMSNPVADAVDVGRPIETGKLILSGASAPLPSFPMDAVHFPGVLVGGGVLSSPQFLPPNLRPSPGGCSSTEVPCGLRGLGSTAALDSDSDPATLAENSNTFALFMRAEPSITARKFDLTAPSPADSFGDLWCRFSHWVQSNPFLAVAGLAAIYMLRKRG